MSLRNPIRLATTRLDRLGLVVLGLDGGRDGLATLVVVVGPENQQIVEVSLRQGAGTEAVLVIPAMTASDANAMVDRILADGGGRHLGRTATDDRAAGLGSSGKDTMALLLGRADVLLGRQVG